MRAAAIVPLMLAACHALDLAAPKTPARPSLARVASASAPEGSYWEREPIELRPSTIPAEPVSEEKLVRAGGAKTKWEESAELRAKILKLGFAIAPRAPAAGDSRGSLAAFFREKEAERTPVVLTMDALLRVVHAVFEAALAEVDGALAPELEKLVVTLDDRLAREEPGAKPDAAPAYARARGVTLVARALLDPTVALTDAVKLELERVRAHLGVATSPVLGRAIDYTVFDVVCGLRDADPRLGRYRAALWLGLASFELGARGSAITPVGQQRTDTRAAILLSRLLREGDALRAWERIVELGTYTLGPPDDLTPRELARVASNVGLDVRAEATLLDVVKVDRVRAAASAKPALSDQIPPLDRAGAPVASVSVRLLGAFAPPESAALARLVAPYVPADASGRERTMPDPLDVAVYLGSAEAASLAKQKGWELAAPYAEVARRSLPVNDPNASHATLHMSFLEALAAYLSPSAGDASALVLSSEWSRRKIDAAIAAWATLRHDETPFARSAAAALGSSAGGSNPLVGVEPHPEAIARLVALVRQITRGLHARGLLKDGAPAHALAHEAFALLAQALALALAEVNGEPPTQPLLEDLAGIFARIEGASGPLGAPLVADVHTDLRGGRALEVGTRPIDELWMVLRDPKTAHPTLYAGPILGHASAQAMPRLNDRAWAAGERARPDWTREPLVTSTSGSP